MSAQTALTICQVFVFVGVIISGVASLASFHFKNAADLEKQGKSTQQQNELRSQVEKLRTTYEADTKVLFAALKIPQEQWVELKAETIPPTTAYLLLLFRSDKGRIEGKIRVKGSDRISAFSTTANDTVPLAIQNAWSSKDQKYNWPVTLELSISAKSQPDASLSILTQGWIDDLGQEPH